MDLQLIDKVFIVTGGTDGLGLATAQALLAEGAKVLVTGRSEDKLGDVRVGLGAGADRIAYVEGDNADAALSAKLRHAVLGRWGRLDGMPFSVGGLPPGKALATEDDTWRNVFDSVFLGAVRLVRDIAPHIADGGAVALMLAISAKKASLTELIATRMDAIIAAGGGERDWSALGKEGD